MLGEHVLRFTRHGECQDLTGSGPALANHAKEAGTL